MCFINLILHICNDLNALFTLFSITEYCNIQHLSSINSLCWSGIYC